MNLIDNKYYGIYRGVVVNNNDPKGLGRVTLRVPQVLGNSITNWAWPVGGAVAQTHYPYGTFTSTQLQPVTAANTATVATFNVTEDNNHVSIADSSKLKVHETGDYFFQFSAQFSKSGSSSAQADIWLRKNGVDIPRTNSRVTFQGNPNEVLATVNFILDLNAEDYVEVMFSSDSSAVSLLHTAAGTSPTRPEIPSIIATLNLVGKFKPKTNQSVWVSFEGGDPNYPIWLGTF